MGGMNSDSLAFLGTGVLQGKQHEKMPYAIFRFEDDKDFLMSVLQHFICCLNLCVSHIGLLI